MEAFGWLTKRVGQKIQVRLQDEWNAVVITGPDETLPSRAHYGQYVSARLDALAIDRNGRVQLELTLTEMEGS